MAPWGTPWVVQADGHENRLRQKRKQSYLVLPLFIVSKLEKKIFFLVSCLFFFPLHNTFKLSSEIGIAEFLSDNHECVLLSRFFSVLVWITFKTFPRQFTDGIAFRSIQDLNGQINGTGEFLGRWWRDWSFKYNTKEGLGDVKDHLPTVHALGEYGREMPQKNSKDHVLDFW